MVLLDHIALPSEYSGMYSALSSELGEPFIKAADSCPAVCSSLLPTLSKNTDATKLILENSYDVFIEGTNRYGARFGEACVFAVDSFLKQSEGIDWITLEKKEEFIRTFDSFAEKSVENGAYVSKTEFYIAYTNARNGIPYTYDTAFINTHFKSYIETGASHICSFEDLNRMINTFDAIGPKDGIFLTSYAEDTKLLSNKIVMNGTHIDPIKLARAKGIGDKKLLEGAFEIVYPPELISEFMKHDKMLRLVTGTETIMNWLEKIILKQEFLLKRRLLN